MGPGRKPAPNFYDVADMHVEKNVWETHLTDTEKHRYLLKAATDVSWVLMKQTSIAPLFKDGDNIVRYS